MSLKGGQKFAIALTTIFTAAATAFLVYAHLNIKPKEEPILDWIPCDTDTYTEELNKTEKTLPKTCKTVCSFYTESDDPDYNPVTDSEYAIDVEFTCKYNTTNKTFAQQGTGVFCVGFPVAPTSARNYLKIKDIILYLAEADDSDTLWTTQYYYGLGFRVTGEIFNKEFPDSPLITYDYICDFKGWPKSGKVIGYNYTHSNKQYYLNTICEYTMTFDD